MKATFHCKDAVVEEDSFLGKRVTVDGIEFYGLIDGIGHKAVLDYIGPDRIVQLCGAKALLHRIGRHEIVTHLDIRERLGS